MKSPLRLAGVLCAALASTLLLMACTTNYSRSDVLAYLDETYPGVDFKVAADPIAQTDPEGYEDQLWLAQSDDGVSFVVLNDYDWGMETLANGLRDNYGDALLTDLVDHGLALGTLRLETSADAEGVGEALLVCDVSTRAELDHAFEDLCQLWERIRAVDPACADFRYLVRMDNPLRNRLSSYVVSDGDVTGSLAGVDEIDIAEFERNFILTALDYRFEDVLADFTPEELAAAVASDPGCAVCVSHGGADGPWEECVGLGVSRYSYGISFGTLFELLQREAATTGIMLQGSAWHYTFIGADGATYEVSYDFYEPDGHYWYYRDGEPVQMEAFYNHFGEKDVFSLTGINIRIGE